MASEPVLSREVYFIQPLTDFLIGGETHWKPDVLRGEACDCDHDGCKRSEWLLSMCCCIKLFESRNELLVPKTRLRGVFEAIVISYLSVGQNRLIESLFAKGTLVTLKFAESCGSARVSLFGYLIHGHYPDLG